MSRNTEEIGTTNDVSSATNEDGRNSERDKKAKTPKILKILLALAVSVLDPLFFYIPVMKNDNRKCISLDKKLETTVISLRSLVDLLYFIYIVARLRHDYMMCREGELVKHLWKIASCLLRVLSVLPLPQVVLLIIVPTMMRGSRFLNAIYWLRSVILCQFVPRVFTTCSFVISGTFWESAKTRAMFSLFIFILAINGIGGFWYFLSAERLVQCWHEACENHVGCLNLFRCNDNNVGNHTLLNDFCPRDAQKTDFFDFGMFSDALQSRVVETTDFPKKLLYCLHWSLLSLSCFGQNLQTSTYVWENVLAISITISGLLLFLFLLGYLQFESIRQLEKRQQAQEMERWKPFKMVPENLKSEVRRHLRYQWLETVGDDTEKFLVNLPQDLCKKIKSELYSDLMKEHLKMLPFEKMNEPLLKAMCGCLSVVSYPDRTYVIQKGKAIDRMLFILHGLLSVGDGCCNYVSLTSGNFCGEEILSWALDSTSSSTLPCSSRDFIALENVRALILKARDLKFVCCHNPKCHSHLMERLQAPEMEDWMPFKEVPPHLKFEVRIFMSYDLQETVGDDMNKFLDKLPEYLRQRIKVELYYELMKKVSLFEKLEKPLLELVCHRLSAVFYPVKTPVIGNGETIDGMLFIECGSLFVDDGCSGSASLKRGDFCGVELLSWALDSTSSILPYSRRDVIALEDVKALSLKANDLKFVAARYPECHRYLMERREAQEMEDWMLFRMVPQRLKPQVRRRLSYNWLETVGNDMEKFLANLPKSFCQSIKVELYFELMKKVSLFRTMDKSSLEAMCHRLSAVFYPDESYVIRKEEVIDGMLFIVHGSLSVEDACSGSTLLRRGDFYGEELLSWALDSTSPKSRCSSKDVIALENVRAVILKAEDLKSVAAQFGWHYDGDSQQGCQQITSSVEANGESKVALRKSPRTPKKNPKYYGDPWQNS